MTQTICKLPEGLREDTDLSDGVFVGSRETSLKMSCTEEPSSGDVVLDSCQAQQPDKALIDDKAGDIYLPSTKQKDCYVKLTGMETGSTFGQRYTWVTNSEKLSRFSWQGIKYIFGGPESLDNEQKEFVIDKAYGDSSISSDIRAAVLNDPSLEDVPAELRFSAALGWLFIRDSGLASPAKETLLKMATDTKVEASVRLKAIDQLERTEKISDITKMTFQLGKDENADPNIRLAALSRVAYQVPAGEIDIAIFQLGTFEALEYVCSHSTELKDAAIEKIRQIGLDPKADPEERWAAISFFRYNDYERLPEFIPSLLLLGKDTKASPNIRTEALLLAVKRTAENSPEQKEAFLSIVAFIKEAPNSVGYFQQTGLWNLKLPDEINEEITSAMFKWFNDKNASKNDRYSALKWISRHPSNFWRWEMAEDMLDFAEDKDTINKLSSYELRDVLRLTIENTEDEGIQIDAVDCFVTNKTNYFRFDSEVTADFIDRLNIPRQRKAFLANDAKFHYIFSAEEGLNTYIARLETKERSRLKPAEKPKPESKLVVRVEQ